MAQFIFPLALLCFGAILSSGLRTLSSAHHAVIHVSNSTTGLAQQHVQLAASQLLLEHFVDPLAEFHDQFEDGGMSHEEQEFLASFYVDADSVFESGIGSSTLIADHVNVTNVVGADSYEQWVQNVNALVSDDYHMHWIDIGPVREYGKPATDSPADNAMAQQWESYSLAPETLGSDSDVFLVDGRFRVATACTALKIGHSGSTVLVHDFERDEYQVLLDIADVVAQVGKLVALQRKPSATDEHINDMWQQHKLNFH